MTEVNDLTQKLILEVTPNRSLQTNISKPSTPRQDERHKHLEQQLRRRISDRHTTKIRPNNEKSGDTVEEGINDSTPNDEKSDNKKKVGGGVDDDFVVITYTVRVRHL